MGPRAVRIRRRGRIHFGDPTWLTREIDAGNPTIVWLGMWGDQSVYEGGYRVVAGMHVMVAYGYDDGGVYLSDPATGGSRVLRLGHLRVDVGRHGRHVPLGVSRLTNF